MISNDLSAAERQKLLDTVAKIWMEILDVEKVGPEDNFFKLGGDSLKAGIMAMQIHKQLHISMDPIEIFDAPTFQRLLGTLASMLMDEERDASN